MKQFFLTLLSFIFLNTLFAQSCLPDGIGFTTQQEIDAFATNYPGCTCIEGDLRIFGKNMTNLAGLSQITQVKGNVRIDYLSAPDFTGLDNLIHVDGHLSVFGSKNSSTAGLEGITYIGGYIRFIFNPFDNLDGLQNVTNLGQGIFLRDNDNLVSLDGLGSIVHAGAGIWICDNDLLSDISSLNSIIENQKLVSVRIKDNPNLAVCNVTPVCDFLNKGGIAEIENNAEGCNTPEEVACCTSVTVSEEVFIYSDMDMFVDGTGTSPATILEVPTFPSEATCNDIVMVGYFRVTGASCESDIEIEITDPMGNPIFMGNIFATCNGAGPSHHIGALYSVTLPIPMATDIAPGNWVVRFSDSNDQNTGVEYLVGFVSLMANCDYTACEEDIEDRHEEIFSMEEVLLYPVPANLHLNIDYHAESTRLLTYEVFSADGKAASRGEEFVVRGKNTFRVDVASLPAGHYYIRMFDNKATQTRPFVKVNP